MTEIDDLQAPHDLPLAQLCIKIFGGSQHTLRAKLTFSQESHGNITKEVGPVSMIFTILIYDASKLQMLSDNRTSYRCSLAK
ncbi:AP-4 complex subunit mu-like [Magnolia sinica]|uniref:AP-4 complex subunit mu-like n=1 Tax=Magnolia sinica TaxID=86752 RepID=UPI00265999FE|nr:AP-4 complex subunit mu-like [Magnolia sinica]XP_058090726.1 AP-4 complex subunit mu-like [Magnolia sinica]XP_058090727.1 AP-4 complex subunit mu-like [Magnolia sinica]XP_058090728.1 AP-4 complex subunit mu-like [Magnolia sinica]